MLCRFGDQFMRLAYGVMLPWHCASSCRHTWRPPRSCSFSSNQSGGHQFCRHLGQKFQIGNRAVIPKIVFVEIWLFQYRYYHLSLDHAGKLACSQRWVNHYSLRVNAGCNPSIELLRIHMRRWSSSHDLAADFIMRAFILSIVAGSKTSKGKPTNGFSVSGVMFSEPPTKLRLLCIVVIWCPKKPANVLARSLGEVCEATLYNVMTHSCYDAIDYHSSWTVFGQISSLEIGEWQTQISIARLAFSLWMSAWLKLNLSLILNIMP